MSVDLELPFTTDLEDSTLKLSPDELFRILQFQRMKGRGEGEFYDEHDLTQQFGEDELYE